LPTSILKRTDVWCPSVEVVIDPRNKSAGID
jgi:hypothetical protein